MANPKVFLHKDNKHQDRYNFTELAQVNPNLKQFVKPNKYGDTSIDFSNSKAVKELNKAILFQSYNLVYWDIPENYLVPPIPSRADYLHYVAELISNEGKAGEEVNVLDIGTGANCIYPILGSQLFQWNFVGTDVDKTAMESARTIVQKNPALEGKVKFRLNKNPKLIFNGLINKKEQFDLVVCNPPFHSSKAQAISANKRKIRNLKSNKKGQEKLNFGGQNNELWYEGGEVRFISQMIMESKRHANNCKWFTSLVSKKESLAPIQRLLEKQTPSQVKVIEMQTGNKTARILAWTFQD